MENNAKSTVVYDEKSCGVVVYREESGKNLFLVLKYPEGHWDFPKGHVEEVDADEHATAARELLEETGISDIEFIANFREEISYQYVRRNGNLSNKQVVFFLAKTELEDIKLSHEHHQSQWMPYRDALAMVTFENAKSLLRKSAELLGEK